MKKLLILVFALMSVQLFAWRKIDILDPKTKKVEQVRIVQEGAKQSEDILFIEDLDPQFKTQLNEKYQIGFMSNTTISPTVSRKQIAVKVDDNKYVLLIGDVIGKNGNIIVANLPDSLVTQMKKGKSMKSLIPKANGEQTVSSYSLMGFSKHIKMVKIK